MMPFYLNEEEFIVVIYLFFEEKFFISLLCCAVVVLLFGSSFFLECAQVFFPLLLEVECSMGNLCKICLKESGNGILLVVGYFIFA